MSKPLSKPLQAKECPSRGHGSVAGVLYGTPELIEWTIPWYAFSEQLDETQQYPLKVLQQQALDLFEEGLNMQLPSDSACASARSSIHVGPGGGCVARNSTLPACKDAKLCGGGTHNEGRRQAPWRGTRA